MKIGSRRDDPITCEVKTCGCLGANRNDPLFIHNEASRLAIMTNKTKTNGERALAAALEELKPCNERTAIIVIFFAAARLLGETFDAETAGDLAYSMADELATGKRR